MNPQLEEILNQADEVLNRHPAVSSYDGPVHVGVDLGTAYTVFVVLDREYRPLAGRYQFTELVRDGLVVDFIGAIQLLKQMRREIEAELGFSLTSAATTYPPGVPIAEVKATRNVVLGTGLECSSFIDEPSGANALLQVRDGAVVDIGGGTTGIAILREGEVVYTADEPTGGTHFSLVIAGAMGIPFEEAEDFKKDPENGRQLFTVVYPVMQKVGTIVARHLANHDVHTIYLVGGTSSMPGLPGVITEITSIQTITPPHPMFVTPVGVAMHDNPG